MNNIMEILDKLQFFGGQRAGRELWADKPTDVQDADVESFNENIEAIRCYIQWLEEKNEAMHEEIVRLQSCVPRWISVEERLPEKNSKVLVLWVGHVFEAASIGDGYVEPLGDRWILAGRDFTHWMPLPEPPKEE